MWVKAWLIVKSQEKTSEAKAIFGDKINITSEGKRHLGAVIGSKVFKNEYCQDITGKWINEIEKLTKIAETQPHAAYIAFTKGYRSKFTYYMRTIPSFEDYVELVDEIILDSFLPTLFGKKEQFPNYMKDLFSLTPNQGGLGIPSLKKTSTSQYNASSLLTKPHVDLIMEQKLTNDPETKQKTDKLMSQNRTSRNKIKKEEVVKVDANLPTDLLTIVKQSRDKGASSWLNALPLVDQKLDLNKEEFRDSISLRYNIPLKGLPSFCACGEKFNVNHALSCKKGGFVSERHDGIRDLLTSLINKVCNNVQTEPHLLPITNETFRLKTANKSSEARLDIKASSFWSRGVTAFFDVRVSHVNSETNKNKETKKIFKEQENEKKRSYLQRVLEVEHGSFTPLVFGTNGGMGDECSLFLKTLAEKLAKKQGESYQNVMSWIRTRLSFEILRSVHLCIRGSRVPFNTKNRFEVDDDFTLNVHSADIF